VAYGIGTRLVTSAGASALNGVYKLVALRHGAEWVPAMKLSDSPSKTPNPGDKGVWRLYDRRNKATADLLSLRDESPGGMPEIVLRHGIEPSSRRVLAQSDLLEIEALQIQAFEGGRVVCPRPDLEEIRRVRSADIERLDPGVKRLMNPHFYHVSLTEKLWELKQTLIASMRAGMPAKTRR